LSFKKIKGIIVRITLPLILALLLSACATNDLGEKRDFNKTELGALIGVVGGAAAGAAINHNNRGKGALIGAIGGGLAGGGIGYYMDKQTKDFQRQLAAEIQRGDITVQKMADQSLLVSMTSNTGFDTNSSVLKAGYTPTLDKIAKIVNQYGKTSISIVGHTDNTGSVAVNQSVSERRAQSVSDYFVSRNVNPVRLDASGRGKAEPRASNETEAGRSLNRRVELRIVPVSA
jgi:outer membrane protein OmpA-like peptidoglycan-associated protein